MDKPGKPTRRLPKAYQDTRFLESKDARALRILAEYLEPLHRFQRHNVQDTIVFMGSARLRSEEAAKAALAEAERTGQGIEAAQTALRLSIYYEAARELARRLTVWSKPSTARSGALSSAPAAVPASWRRPIAALPRQRGSMSG